jgi:hypothetical protein
MPPKFSRPTLVAATELLARHSHGDFTVVALKFGLQDKIPAANLITKAAAVTTFVLQDPDALIATSDGDRTRAELLVSLAAKKFNPHYQNDADTDFRRALAHDGYALDAADGSVTLLPMVPQELDLPAADDEVHRLLKQFEFHAPLGHLNQAIEGYRLGNWASANAQLPILPGRSAAGDRDWLLFSPRNA